MMCLRGHWVLWRMTDGQEPLWRMTDGQEPQATRLRFHLRSCAKRAARRLDKRAGWLHTTYHVRYDA